MYVQIAIVYIYRSMLSACDILLLKLQSIGSLEDRREPFGKSPNKHITTTTTNDDDDDDDDMVVYNK